MRDAKDPPIPDPEMSEVDRAGGQLWPSQLYARQIERLRAAIGQPIYLMEMVLTEVTLGIRQTGKPYALLDVLDFPRPDPARGLAPHLILLSDGRGVNLGQIARITVERPFSPSPSEILYQDTDALEGLVFRERRLSPEFIAERSRFLLGQVLRKETPPASLEWHEADGQDDPPDKA